MRQQPKNSQNMHVENMTAKHSSLKVAVEADESATIQTSTAPDNKPTAHTHTHYAIDSTSNTDDIEATAMAVSQHNHLVNDQSESDTDTYTNNSDDSDTSKLAEHPQKNSQSECYHAKQLNPQSHSLANTRIDSRKMDSRQNSRTQKHKNARQPNPRQPNASHALILADVKWFIIWALLGGVLGAYAGEMAWGIVVGMTAFYIWQAYAMEQFYLWLNRSTTLPPPSFSGSLSFIANQIYDSKKQEELTHQKTMGLIKKIRASLLALQDAVILLDKNDSLEWWNQAAENLLELRSKDQGRSILDLINIAAFHNYYTHSTTLTDGVRLQSWRNPERFLQCEVTHFGQEKLLIIYDVTRLQHLEQMRKDFVGNVSHELRTPLTVLMGYIETFSDQDDLDPKWQRGFTLMLQQTKRMNSLINDLLLLSRLENEEVNEKKCVNMPRMLVEIFDDAQVYNRDYNHLIDLHIDSQKNLYGSEMYLNSALLNLVTNAIKYTPKNGEIDISWQEVKGGCLFSVSDNGIGIDKEHIERLTERFYRVDDGRSRATGGTGLGLAIVKHVLYQHNAKLTIESTKDKGSTFNVFFPNRQVCGDNSADSDSQDSDSQASHNQE